MYLLISKGYNVDCPKFIRIYSAEEKNIDIKEAVVLCLNKWVGWTGKEINNGNCDLFADDLIELVGGEIWETNWDHPDNLLMHTFVKYKGKYYDAETPDGVQNAEQLPFFQ